MKKLLTGALTFLMGLGFAAGDLSSAYAQDKSSDEFTLEEITVTAQKREENQQKVAIAMEVVSGELLKELAKNDIAKILDNVSSVMINTNQDGLRVSIRGISNDNPVMNNMQASTPTVAVNTDGVYTNRNSANSNLYDIERVEVLYGPQSTMYASASPGGIVNVVTSNPKTDRYEASGTLEYGNYNLLHTEGSVNAPVNDKIAFRAAFSTSQHDGYLSNGSEDEDTKSARLKALFQPNEKVSIVVTGEFSKSGGQGFAFAKAFVNQDDEYYPDGTKITNKWTSSSGSAGTGMDRKNKKISGRMDWDAGYAGTLSVVPSYSKGSNYSSSTGADPFTGMQSSNINTGKQDEKGIEARMVSSADFPFKWIFGVNAYKSMDTQNSVSIPESGSTRYGTNWNSQKTRAIYGNLTYPVTDIFRATLGLRKTWDTNHTYSYDSGRGGEPEESEQEFNGLNYMAGFEYDIGTNSMLYGDWKTSYRTQGMAFDSLGRPFDPEELTSYTLGAKNRFFNNRLQVNISAYDYEYKNYMGAIGVPIRRPQNDDGTGNLVEDEGSKVLGQARIYGADLQTSTIISNMDRLDLSISYTRKYFVEHFNDYSDYTNNVIGVPDLDYAGYDMTLAPHWTASGNYSHNFLLGNGGTVTARIDFRYQSKYCLNWAEFYPSWTQDAEGIYHVSLNPASPTRFQEAYHTENISLVYSHSDGKWTLTGYVNNLTNYAVKRNFQSMMANNPQLMLGPPRTYGGVLSMKF